MPEAGFPVFSLTHYHAFCLLSFLPSQHKGCLAQVPSHQGGWTLVLHPKTDTMETDAEPGSSHVQVFGEEDPLQCLDKQSPLLMPSMRGSPLSYRERAPPDWF